MMSDSSEEWVSVFISADETALTLVKIAFEAAEIPFEVKGEGLHNLFGAASMAPEIRVRRGDEADARALLEEMTREIEEGPDSREFPGG